MAVSTFASIEKLRKPLSKAIAIPLIFAALVTVPKNLGNGFHETLEQIGYLLLITAGIGRIWCSLYIAGRKDQTLCTEGPYSLCRNPLYLFSFIGVAGVFLALQSLLLTAIAVVFYLLYYSYVIRCEEKRLLNIFGAPFSTYMTVVPRFIPSFSNYNSGAEERMTSTKVIERGLREVVWFFIAIVLIEIVEVIHLNDLMVLYVLPF